MYTAQEQSTTQAKLIDAGDRRTVYVVGSFKSSSSSSPDLSSSEPQFKLALTSHITTADVNLGYLMTGTLERGRHGDSLQPTHFAVLRIKMRRIWVSRDALLIWLSTTTCALLYRRRSVASRYVATAVQLSALIKPQAHLNRKNR
uniref:Uncharacterized protein n=1 Tax=Daphnia galeata TaxID=27404 RepID=A0A8J2RJ82_9CRUS|nr:unnamed protein product [Daphnia galeata]